ncbi:MAG: carboxylesterase/lipase family protein [Gemmatimonadaceae bacterium]
MTLPALRFSVVIGAVLSGLVGANRADPPRVTIDTGTLEGVVDSASGVNVFRGIPYAAPPVGPLRWRPPQPAAHWTGVRPASQLGHNCIQHQPYGDIDPFAAGISEDCLYLNVWTSSLPLPASRVPRPVLVWIHGGGFFAGFGGEERHNGAPLAKKGAVVVTLNYRLGAFGFLAHPALAAKAESPHRAAGNYGLLDQIAALQWVQRNIARFGGDPSRVTIFGESAGSWAVNTLMASPLAKGLFQRAIGESGGSFSAMKTLAEAEKEGEKLAAALTSSPGVEPNAEGGQTTGAASTLKALRAKTAEELLKASDSETVRTIVDGWVLPQDVATIFAQGKQNDVPLIVGYNADEGTALAPQAANLKAMMFIGGVYQRYGSRADALLKVYPAASDEEAVSSFYSAYRDQVFGWEMRTWARMATQTGHQPAYMYYFSRRPPGPQSAKLRAFHASEIAYVFGTFVWPFPWDDTDKKLSDAMTSY